MAQVKYPHPWTRLEPPMCNMSGGPLSPLLIVPDPSVISSATGYTMYYTNSNSLDQVGFARATSLNGRDWTVWVHPTAPDPIIDLVLTAPAGAWDGLGIETANIVIGHDGHHRLYYSGNLAPQGSLTYAIGMAISFDGGIAWTRTGVPVLEGLNSWELPDANGTTGGVLEPSVIYDAAAGIYRMWYAALGEKNGTRTFRIGYATSTDGEAWTRLPDPVFVRSASGNWDDLWVSHVNVVADRVSGYHMFYFGSKASEYVEGAVMQKGRIGHAYSANGTAWTRNTHNPIISPRAGNIDAWMVGGPSAIAEVGKMRLWFFGTPTSAITSQAQLAEASGS